MKKNKKFVPVLFVLLSDVNGTAPHTLLDRVGRFLRDLSFATKSHLACPVGIERGDNAHAHVIVQVAEDELHRFRKKYGKFSPEKAWPRRKMAIRMWEDGHDTYGYTVRKHQSGWESVCPGQRNCRKVCSHF